MKFVCTKPCWHMGKKWRLGEIGDFSEGEFPKDKAENVLHFKALDSPPRGPGRPPKVEAVPVTPPSGVEVKVNKEARIK